MADDAPKPSRRFPRAGWMAVGLIVLLLASPLLVELWRQHDISNARNEYRRALRETSQPWAHVTDWDAWYRANVPDGEGQQAFARLCAEAVALDKKYDLMFEDTDVRLWLTTGERPNPSGFSQHRVDAYLADSEELSHSGSALLSHSKLLGPPVEPARESVVPMISLFRALECRALFLAWHGRFSDALEVCRLGLELAQRLQPPSKWNDCYAGIAVRPFLSITIATLICAAPAGDTCATWPRHLLADYVLDEVQALELERQSHAVLAMTSDEALTKHVAMWDWPGSLPWFGWTGLDQSTEVRHEKFTFAAQHFRWLRDDTYLTESNWKSLRRGETVSNEQACASLRKLRYSAAVANLHARRTRAALALRVQDAAGQPLSLDAAAFPLVRIKEQDGVTYLCLEPDVATLTQLGQDRDDFEREFEPIRFQRSR